MPVRCREEAEKVLGPHFDDFASIVLESVRFYYEFYGERAHAHESWTRCSIIRDEIKERMTVYCEATKGLQPLRDGNATYFGAHSKFTLRIKKLFDDLRANTGKTQISFGTSITRRRFLVSFSPTMISRTSISATSRPKMIR
jgi:hypothetical protein